MDIFSTTTSMFLYGKGIFTTVSVYDRRPCLWKKHWRRLNINAKSVRIDLAEYSESGVVEQLNDRIETDRIVNGRVRVTFSDQSPSDIWSKDSNPETGLNIVAGPLRPIAEEFQLGASLFPLNSRSPLASVKSCNYLEQILSLDEAKGRGFHEAVRVNERGHVTSGCMSNILWLKNNRLYTPTLATGCLAGTTREYVLENVECEEVEAEIGELESAEAIYLTSAGLGIVRVAEFEGRELPYTKHPIQNLWPPS